MHASVRAASVVAGLFMLAGVATPAFAARAHESAASVKVVAIEFKFTVTPSVISKPGAVTFTVLNRGRVAHDFKIAGKKTPLIQPDKSATLKVTLKAGRWPYVCTVPGHAAAGMKGVFTVK